MLPTLVRRAPEVRAGVLGRPAVASLVLAVAYLAVALLGDPHAGLGSDSGGKLATARVMAEAGTIDPDVGYWAADADPDGRFHPLVNTERKGSAWVQATSIPYSILTAGLWSVAGPLGPVLLSIAGGVAAALAARRMAARLGGDPDLAFWLVGLASPLAVYATDAWEHAPALGLTLWGLAIALEAERPRSAALAGALLGAALVLRAEVGAVVLAFGVAVLAVTEVRRRWTSRPAQMAAAALAGGLVLVANGVLERLVLADAVRTSRAGNGAASAGSEPLQRLSDAVLTGVGLFADQSAAGLLLGGVMAVGLGMLGLRVAGSPLVTDRTARAATVVVVALYALRVLDGWSFVPGALAVAPVVVLAALAPRTAEVRVVLLTAVGAVPVVWATQWTGNHVAQWGGRYLLPCTALLVVLAAVTLSGPRGRGPLPRLLVVLTLVASLSGLGWHVVRTDAVGGIAAAVAGLPEDTVVVSTDQHLGRDIGTVYGDRRWLATVPDALDEALAVAEAAAPGTITVLGRPQADGTSVPLPDLDGYHLAEEGTIPTFGDDLEVRVLARD